MRITGLSLRTFRQIAVVCLMLTALVMIAACSAFQKPDGTRAVAPDPAKIEAAAAAAAASVSPIPVYGTAAAALIGLLGTGLAAHYRGKEVGWTEASGTPGTPATPPIPGQARTVS